MEKQKDYNKYDDEIQDIDEIVGTDIKINPDFYIHTAILKAQNCLSKENVKEGFLQFRVMVEHIQILTEAATILSDDYKKEMNKYKKTEEYEKETNDEVRLTKLANYKLKFLLKEVFSSKISTEPLKA